MVMQNKSVIQLQIEIEEIGSILHTVFLDITESSFRSIYRCIVRNDHLTGVDTRQREIKVLQRRRRESKITVVIRCTHHTLGGQLFIIYFGPNFSFRIAATLCRET